MKANRLFCLLMMLIAGQAPAQCLMEWHEDSYTAQWVPQEKVFRFFSGSKSDDTLSERCHAVFEAYKPGDTVVWRMWPGLYSRLLALSWNPNETGKKKSVAVCLVELTDFKVTGLASSRAKIPGNARFVRMNREVADFVVPGKAGNLCLNIISPKRAAVHVFESEYDHKPVDTAYYEHRVTGCGSRVYNPFGYAEENKREEMLRYAKDSLLSPQLAALRQKIRQRSATGTYFATTGFGTEYALNLQLYDQPQATWTNAGTPTYTQVYLYCLKKDFNKTMLLVKLAFSVPEIEDSATVLMTKKFDSAGVVGYLMQWRSSQVMYLQFLAPALQGKPYFLVTRVSYDPALEEADEILKPEVFFESNQDLYTILNSSDPKGTLYAWLGQKCIAEQQYCREAYLASALKVLMEHEGYHLDKEMAEVYHPGEPIEVGTKITGGNVVVICIDNSGKPSLQFRPSDEYDWRDREFQNMFKYDKNSTYVYRRSLLGLDRYELKIELKEWGGYQLLLFSK